MPEPGKLNIAGGEFEIDAATVAQGLRLDISNLKEGLKDGGITCRVERGEEADAGRFRVTFFSENCEFRLITDSGGRVVQRSVINFGAAARNRRQKTDKIVS
ncbi:MAG: hypothetical protein EP348_09355 [Alphaproteobacteria bacterium]|nr:MAG: hypothetical protein EP348_09355 [Alphaproteobacteria bacterium]